MQGWFYASEHQEKDMISSQMLRNPFGKSTDNFLLAKNIFKKTGIAKVI
jgi:hypothetical protein